MKHGLLAITALLALAVGSASAYFVEITVDLTKQDELKGQDNQGGQNAGQFPMGGNAGMAGIGGIGGNRGGPPMGFGGMPGMAGIAGAGGGRPPMGMAGMAGIAGNRGGAPPMGFAGMPGMAGAGGFGGAQGAGGAGGFGGFGGFAGFNGFGGFGNLGGNDEPPPKILARVVVELKEKGISGGTVGKNRYYALEHQWGRAILVPSDAIKMKLYETPPVLTQYKKKRVQVLRDKTDKTLWLELAAWVLKHGLVKEFPKIMAEVKKLDPQDPAVLAFAKLQAAWQRKPNLDEPTAIWMKQQVVKESYKPWYSKEGHYTLLTYSNDQPEIKKQLSRLEDTYHGFFYWFALKGQVLQVPRYRLVVVLVTDPARFKDQRLSFRSVPMVADGFTIPRDNVAVISAKPWHNIYTLLDKLNQQIWDPKNNRNDLLKGTKKGLPSLQKANHQVLALVQKVMEEESAQATISHEGIYQLMAATGLPGREGSKLRVPVMARNLAGPEWLKFGMASFFETPRGAYWPGTSAPSWKYLIQFTLADEDKKFADMEPVLEKVISDSYFREAYASKGRQRQQKLEFARTTSWALAYYLAEKHPDKLLTYFYNLSKLPRNMEFDRTVLKNLFVQSFLSDPKSPKKGLQRFANNWRHVIRNTKLEIPKLVEDARKERADELAARKKAREDAGKQRGGGFGPNQPPFGPPNGPMGPMGPGGGRKPPP